MRKGDARTVTMLVVVKSFQMGAHTLIDQSTHMECARTAILVNIIVKGELKEDFKLHSKKSMESRKLKSKAKEARPLSR
jgi:hypothetical protein